MPPTRCLGCTAAAVLVAAGLSGCNADGGSGLWQRTVDPVVLASMLPIEIDDLTVILWGATERMVLDLEAVVPRSRGFIPCAADATHDDLAMLVRSLG